MKEIEYRRKYKCYRIVNFWYMFRNEVTMIVEIENVHGVSIESGFSSLFSIRSSILLIFE